MTIISPLIRMQQQLRIFHWQTKSYAQHKAFGKAYEALDDQIDAFVEEFMGKYGRPIARMSFNIELDNYNDTDYLAVINDYIHFLSEELPVNLNLEADTDLLNIRDDMLGGLNRLKYLLTLK